MLYGLAKMWKMFGVHSITSTNRAPLNPRILVTYSLNFCKFKKIIERRFLLFQLGSYGTGETLSILFVEVGRVCGLNCHKPKSSSIRKPSSPRNIIPSIVDLLYIYIYILGLC